MVKIKEKEKKIIIDLYKNGKPLEHILKKLESEGFKNNKNLLFSKIRSIPELRPYLNKDRITFDEIEKFMNEIKLNKRKSSK